MTDKILLVDGHSIINRAFYGLPDLTNSEGVHTGAVYGFLNILLRMLEEEKPSYLAVAFDVHAPTFRHEMYADYKGTRHAMPEELRELVARTDEISAGYEGFQANICLDYGGRDEIITAARRYAEDLAAGRTDGELTEDLFSSYLYLTFLTILHINHCSSS